MKTKISIAIFFIAALLFALPFVLNAQSNQAFTLTADDLANGKTAELNEAGWKYQAGDDARFAEPNFDDSDWETLKNSAMTKDSLPQTGWNGGGWFRLHLNVAPELMDNPLNFEVGQLGASEIYLDGKLIKKFGMIGDTAATEQPYNPNAEPLAIVFDSAGEHLLAVRYSNKAAADANTGYGKWIAGKGIVPGAVDGIAFSSRLKSFDNAVSQSWGTGYSFPYMWALVMVELSFFFLHFLLFVLYPRQRGNLYFSLFLLLQVLSNFFSMPILFFHYGTVIYYWCYYLTFLTGTFSAVPMLAFLYTDFEGRIPRINRVFFGYIFLIGIGFFFYRSQIFSSLYSILNIYFAIECTRIMVQAIRRRRQDAWIVGIGVFLIDMLLLREITIGLGIVEIPVSIYYILDVLGLYGLLVSLTIYLARQFARTSTNLDAQLVKQVEHERAASQLALEREQEKARFAIVEAENERRAKELEDARQLQLSMLPKELPVIPNLEIAAYMKPATEVGGDYYDFHVGADGTLTVAVGDATGHGLKAGSVVTATKSLFNAFAGDADISNTLSCLSQALKKMNLRGLFMAMTMLKVKDGEINLSIAGMPSVLIYRSENNRVEEIAIRAMPLGSFAKTNYRQQQILLGKADVVVVMSDGFPEMFNPENEMLGFDKATEILPTIAANSPQEIINELVKVGEDWASGRPQDDDVTFVVLKIGDNANIN